MYVKIAPGTLGYVSGLMQVAGPGWLLSTADVCSFEVKERNFNLPGLGDRVVQVSMEELLLCVGLATTPATSHTQPNAWGFFVEHLGSFRAGSGRLRAVASVAGWDTHQKGAFSDRLGMGVAAWALWNHYDVVHLADADLFIGRAVAKAPPPIQSAWLKSLGKYGKTGKYKPDFFCLNRSVEVVIAEAKGAIGAPSTLAADIRKGKEQVANVEPVGLPLHPTTSRLVFGFNVRREDERPRAGKDTGLQVVDPDGDENRVPVEVTEEDIIRASYAKILNFVGDFVLADALLRSSLPLLRADDVTESAEDIDGYRVMPLVLMPGFAVGLDVGVARALFSSERGQLSTHLREAIARFREAQRGGRDARPVVLPNGVVASFSW